MQVDEQKRKKQEEYFAEICYFAKSKESWLPNNRDSNLNRTELRLISEIIAAQYGGERVISTQLAKRIGVTRSAVSQIVANLEKAGVLCRVPSPTDKKIAYVEIADGAIKKYGEALDCVLSFLGETVEEFGEENFLQMCKLFRQFVDVVNEKKKKINE